MIFHTLTRSFSRLTARESSILLSSAKYQAALQCLAENKNAQARDFLIAERNRIMEKEPGEVNLALYLTTRLALLAKTLGNSEEFLRLTQQAFLENVSFRGEHDPDNLKFL
jgi:hypothetical protein